MYSGRPRHDYTIKAQFIKFQIVDPEIYSILIFLKGLKLVSHFVYYILCIIFKKNISVVFY